MARKKNVQCKANKNNSNSNVNYTVHRSWMVTIYACDTYSYIHTLGERESEREKDEGRERNMHAHTRQTYFSMAHSQFHKIQFMQWAHTRRRARDLYTIYMLLTFKETNMA